MWKSHPESFISVSEFEGEETKTIFVEVDFDLETREILNDLETMELLGEAEEDFRAGRWIDGKDVCKSPKPN